MDPTQMIPQAPQGMDNSQPVPMPAQTPQVDPIAQMPQGTPDGNQPITPEQKQELLKLLEDAKSMQGEINSRMFMNKNSQTSSQQDLQKQVFTMLQELGVDLNNPDSIRKFLGDLEQSNPDLFTLVTQLLDEAFKGTGDPLPSQLESGVPPSGQNPEELQGILSQM